MGKTARDTFLERQAFIQDSFENRNVKKVVNDDATGLFLSNSLELINPTLYKPLKQFFWYRDMPVKYGGGAIEDASFFKTNYSISQGNAQASGQNDVITTIKTTIEKQRTRVKAFAWNLEVSIIDQMKADQVGFDRLKLYDEGLRMSYNKTLDDIAFNGFAELSDSYGLFNNTNVKSKELDENFENMTGSELLDLLNGEILDMIEDMGYDSSYVPDRILVPIKYFTQLARPLGIGGTDSAISVLDYLERNLAANMAKYGTSIKIFGNKYLTDAGKNSKGRIVIYKYSEDVVCMPLPMELTPGASVLDPGTQSVKTSYVAFIGEPQFIYLTPIRYLDNVAAS